ncbi:hypothetical protein BKA70DRAFT_1232433 [Coprinopsis sp. MPI-PUGE-AT-0042]|nr:hypothetical protein BKA70DRAFT_1232433 [Coprinopsis sp. MPI-PUGE-AT-0042]
MATTSGHRSYIDVLTVYIWAGALKSRLPHRFAGSGQSRAKPVERFFMFASTALDHRLQQLPDLLAKLCFDPKSSRSTTTKRDSLAAELETGELAAFRRMALWFLEVPRGWLPEPTSIWGIDGILPTVKGKEQEHEVYDQAKTTATQKSPLATLNHRVELLEHELSQCQHIADERSRILAGLQTQYDELVAQRDSWCIMKRSRRVMGVVREELHRQTEYLEAKNVKLTSELLYLREQNQSIEALREEKRGLETQLVGLDKLKEKVVRLEAEVEAGRLEREAWQQQHAILSNHLRHPSLDRPPHHTRHAQLLEEQEHAAPETNPGPRSGSPSSQGRTQAKRHGVILVEREVGYLQALLSNFKAEEAYDDNATPAVDSVKVANMEELEALLAEYANVNDQLTNDLGALEGPMVLTEELERVEQEKKALRQTIPKHEQEITPQATKIDELKQALFDPSREIAAGRHIPPRTRVLCMPENPDQAWVDLGQTMMDRDNEALIKRLEEPEESEVSSITSSQTRRRAGAFGYATAIGAETEQNPLAPIIGIAKPSFGDARSDGVYTGQRGALAAFHYVTKSSGMTQSLLGHARTALNLDTLEFEVEREVSFEYAGGVRAFNTGWSVCPSYGLTDSGDKKPGLHAQGGTPAYLAAVSGSNPRLDFGESSLEIARSLTDGIKAGGLQNHGGCANRAFKPPCAHVVGAASLDGIEDRRKNRTRLHGQNPKEEDWNLTPLGCWTRVAGDAASALLE